MSSINPSITIVNDNWIRGIRPPRRINRRRNRRPRNADANNVFRIRVRTINEDTAKFDVILLPPSFIREIFYKFVIIKTLAMFTIGPLE
ncbi:8512_t:CDS:2 [Funneliformis geosporum]|uniref:8512_t:CDS:1 n=1 Tax=Funneliformis geosporum TaxID=1117311 RepID=A0A9W4SXM2_9GLOM|nr:8512_t:CDS:2 [Funneliformis geosporum]